MRIENEVLLDYRDVLLRPKRSTLASRNEVDLNRDYRFKYGQESWNGVGVISANMDSVGTFSIARVLSKYNMLTALHKHYDADILVKFFSEELDVAHNCFYSLGITEKDLEKFNYVKAKLKDIDGRHYISKICVDVANGYTQIFVDFLNKFRNDNPESIIMAGNVVTAEMTEELVLSGVDIVKVGIGGGSCCTTRKITGIGIPQLSANIECADAAHGLGAMICGDGGITCPGDVVKGFGSGADLIMIGGMFAGHLESEADTPMVYKFISDDARKSVSKDEDFINLTRILDLNVSELDQKYLTKFGNILTKVPVGGKMTFYGMSSHAAQAKHGEGVKEYRASEGKVVEIPYRGPIENTIKEILGGIRSGMTYIGAKKLKEIPKRTTFVRVSQQLNEVFGKS